MLLKLQYLSKITLSLLFMLLLVTSGDLIFLQFTTCDHEISSSQECFRTVFVLVNSVNMSSPKECNSCIPECLSVHLLFKGQT